ADSDNPEIGYLTVWNDTAPPQNFRINKKRFMETLNQKDSIEGDASGFDVVGRRKPPNFTSDELEMVFGRDPAVVEFLRCRKATHHPPPELRLQAANCEFVRVTPGGGIQGLFWEAFV